MADLVSGARELRQQTRRYIGIQERASSIASEGAHHRTACSIDKEGLQTAVGCAVWKFVEDATAQRKERRVWVLLNWRVNSHLGGVPPFGEDARPQRCRFTSALLLS